MNKHTSLDIGCGWKKRGDIGIDVNRSKSSCDVVADAECLPFRDEVFEKIFLYTVLEHFEPGHWEIVLKEAKRVAKNKALFEIVIPVNAQFFLEKIKQLVLEFPFGVLIAFRALRAHRKFGKFPGVLHKTRLRPEHIGKIVNLIEVRKTSKFPHSWFLGRKGILLAKLFGGVKMESVHKVWHIKAIEVK